MPLLNLIRGATGRGAVTAALLMASTYAGLGPTDVLSAQQTSTPPPQAKRLSSRQDDADKNGKATTQSQFDEQAAFKHLEAICKFGPRVSASLGMKKQQSYIQEHFQKDRGPSTDSSLQRAKSLHRQLGPIAQHHCPVASGSKTATTDLLPSRHPSIRGFGSQKSASEIHWRQRRRQWRRAAL